MKFMSTIFKTFISLLILIGHVGIGYSQTASILPNAETTFVDKNGKPLTSGTVEFFIPGTTTQKMTWKDSGQTIPNTNPITLNSSGRAIIFGDGSYRQVLKDRYGNIIWDGYTSSAGSGGGGTTPTVGDGDAVGTVKAWSGFTAPHGYVFVYGQELTRSSYPEAFAALTSEQNVSCTTGSPILTGVGETSQLPIGAPIESSCLNTGATIISKTTSTVTASSNAIISTTTIARFFPFGNGDGSLTFNVPDLRGRTIAGNDIMGGIAANRLTSTYFGADADALGASGGSQSKIIITSNLPPYTPTGTITNGAITSAQPGGGVIGINGSTSGSGANNSPGGTQTLNIISSQAASTFTGSSQGGTSSPFSVVQPTQTYNYIIKVIPDSNPNSFFGVASIGGMVGVIDCGFGVTCAGNTISAVASTIPAPTPTTLGGIFSSNAPLNQFSNGIDTSGNVLYAQPSFSDLIGTILSTQIANNTITNAMLATSPALSVLGNNTNTIANRTDITATNDGNVLRRSGTSIDFGAIDLTSSNSVTGILSDTNLPTATSTTKGIVQGDGSTLNIVAGTISCTTGSSSQLGCLKPDGTTITSTGGTLTAIGGSATSVDVGTTTVTSGTSGYYLYNNSGVLGNIQTIPDDDITHLGTGTSPLSNTVKDILNQPVNMSYYALNNGSNQTTGVANAIGAWSATDQRSLIIPSGTFYATSWPNLLTPKHKMIGENKPYLKSDASTAFSITTTPGNYYFDELIQGVIFAGNSTSTTGYVFYADKMHQLKLVDVTICEANSANATGIMLNWSVSASIIRTVISQNADSLSTPCLNMPLVGIQLGSGTVSGTSAGATYIENPTIEYVTATGILLENAFSTIINGGTSESNGGGLLINTSSFSNTIVGTDFEANSTFDVRIYGNGNTLLNVEATSPVAEGGVHIFSGATGNIIKGGRYHNITIDAGAKNTVVIGARYINSFNDNGTGTVVINVCNASTAACAANHL